MSLPAASISINRGGIQMDQDMNPYKRQFFEAELKIIKCFMQLEN